MIHPDDKCGAPWCHRLHARAAGKVRRRIGSIDVCQTCYQRTWRRAKALKKSMVAIFPDQVGPPVRAVKDGGICARENCLISIKYLSVGRNNRRRIADRSKTREFIVCQSCYQTAWKASKKLKCTIYEAFLTLSPKGRGQEEPRHQHVRSLQITRIPRPKPKAGSQVCPGKYCENTLSTDAPTITDPINGTPRARFSICPCCYETTQAESVMYGISMYYAWEAVQAGPISPKP